VSFVGRRVVVAIIGQSAGWQYVPEVSRRIAVA
jgi:hypothetical protein